MKAEARGVPAEAEERKYCVYMHKFPNGKVYIGITGVNPKQRWKRGKNYRSNVYITRAIKKYGWDNIDHIILKDGMGKEAAEEMEKTMISAWRSNHPRHGYNITSGGECIGKHSEETRRKIGELARERNKNPAFRKKQSESHKGIEPKNKGVPMSDEQKYKLHLAKLGSPGPGKRKVVCIETGTTYGSISEASKETGCSPGRIVEVCKHHRKTTGGYHWEYLEEE